jgi:prepilin-type N-terminal cleavage/methylation domain-containing protein
MTFACASEVKVTRQRRDQGVTLLELLVVLMILSLILTAAVKTWDVTLQRGRIEQTTQKLDRLASVITGDPNYVVAGRRVDFGYVGDMGELPLTLADLVVRPTRADTNAWRGPYIRATFNESPNGYRIDGWGDTIIYGRAAYGLDSLFVRSYSGEGLSDRTKWLTRYFGYRWTELLQDTVDGRVEDVRGVLPDSNLFVNGTATGIIRVYLEYRRDGRIDTVSLNRLPGGLFTTHTSEGPAPVIYPVPQGTHRLWAQHINFYAVPNETTTTAVNVTVYPRLGARGVVLRMNLDWSLLP